jgi:PAS domain S-box-containing protein
MALDPEPCDPFARTADLRALSRGIFEHSPVPYAVFSREGRFVLANPAYRKMWGREPPPEYCLFDDEVLRRIGLTSMFEGALEGVTATSQPFWHDPAELAHVDVRDAKRVAIACTVFPLRDEGGKVAQVAVAYNELTRELLLLERAEAEERRARALTQAAEAQAALHEAIVHHIGDGVVVADASGVVRIANPATAQQHGTSRVDVPAHEWSSVYHLHTLERQPLPLVETPLYRALNGERVVGARWLVHRPDDAWRTLTGTATPLLLTDGAKAGAVLITRDETERLELEAQLRGALDELSRERETLVRAESEFRAMFELAGVGMSQADPADGHLLRVNQRFCAITGYSAEELLSMRFSDITHPSEREEDFAAYQRMVRGESPTYRREKRYVRKDGEFVWVQVTATMQRDASGAASRSIAVVIDISERKRVEELAKAIADNASAGLFMMDHRQHCVFMNPAAEQITGFSLVELAGRPLHDFVHHTRPDGRPYPISECPIDRAFPEHRQTRGEDVFVRKDGSFYPVAFTASPLRDLAGVPSGTIIELRDTSEEKRTQAERDRLLCELEQAVRVRDDFLSIAGHEIRTPLTALMLNLQGLLATADPDDPRASHHEQRLGRAIDNAERLQRLVEELLDVSRIVASRLSLDAEQFDLVALVRQVAARLGEQAQRSGTQLVVRASGPLRGVWDRSRLEQVVSNLLTNALKYGAGRPIEVALREERAHAVLEVTDHGIGIAAEHHARIFERFERAVSNRHYGGLGLGLWIARQVVEASGGSITVSSEPERGSCFTVRLPLRPGATVHAG